MLEFGAAVVELIVGLDDSVTQEHRASLRCHDMVPGTHFVRELIARERVHHRVLPAVRFTQLLVDALPCRAFPQVFDTIPTDRDNPFPSELVPMAGTGTRREQPNPSITEVLRVPCVGVVRGW